jgi:hypothetical protein
MNYVLGKGILNILNHVIFPAKIYEFCLWSQQVDIAGGKDDMYMLSGCELIDAENISLPRQNMKLGQQHH